MSKNDKNMGRENLPEHIIRELDLIEKRQESLREDHTTKTYPYEVNDWQVLPGFHEPDTTPIASLKTLEDLLGQDKRREEDGFTRRIRLGKLIKPAPGKKGKIVIVPTTTEPKFYHDDSVTSEEETGGSGEGDEGEVIGQQQAEPQKGEGEGQGAGEGDSSSHEEGTNAFDLGKVLTEKFKLPNIKDKGKKRALNKFVYDLTDRNRRFGQLLEKKATLKKIVETNILLGNIKPGEPIDTQNFIIGPRDQIFRIMSAERDFETQAIVFFVRDYSGSMQGKPTEAIVTQHLFIYSWLMYQYQNNVQTRFIVHDTEAKEVPDFQQYYQLQVAGGTRVAPAFKMVNQIIAEENLAADYNIYVFYGTDGDDWDSDGKELTEELKKLFSDTSRIGFTVAKNAWGSANKTTVERTIEKSGFAEKRRDKFRIDNFQAESADENRLIESIKKLVSP